MNTRLPTVVQKLEKSILLGYDSEPDIGLDLAGRTQIYEVLDEILAILFPGSFGKQRVNRNDMNFVISDSLRHLSHTLSHHIQDVFKYRCFKKKCSDCTCEQHAEETVISLIEGLPAIRQTLLADISAAYDGDPAAHYIDEIVLSYPCIEAIATHRVAHALYKHDVPIIPRIMAERAHSRTGIDIHPGASIGPRFFIDHGTGVVIGETAVIGKNVKLYQGVTLGALSFKLDKSGKPIKGIKRHPNIEDDVIIYANATILGGNTTIGKGSVIGGSTWITESVVAGSIVYGAPASRETLIRQTKKTPKK